MTRPERLALAEKVLKRHLETPHTPRDNGEPCACDLCIICDAAIEMKTAMDKLLATLGLTHLAVQQS